LDPVRDHSVILKDFCDNMYKTIAVVFI